MRGASARDPPDPRASAYADKLSALQKAQFDETEYL